MLQTDHFSILHECDTWVYWYNTLLSLPWRIYHIQQKYEDISNQIFYLAQDWYHSTETMSQKPHMFNAELLEYTCVTSTENMPHSTKKTR